MKKLVMVLLCLLAVVAPVRADDTPTANPNVIPEPPSKGGDVVLDIHGEISASTTVQALQAAGEVKERHADRLVIKIMSPGGSVFDGLAMMQVLQDLKDQTGVQVVCQADIAISMAWILFESPICAGNREVKPHSILMTHGIKGGGDDSTIPTVESHLKALRAIEMALCELVAPQVGMTPEEVYEMARRGEEWATGREAVARNWADRFVEPKVVPLAQR